MLKFYEDGSVYVGKMVGGQRHGIGSLYFLDDYFSTSKISGEWIQDKLNGMVTISTPSYIENGEYFDGVKNGRFLRKYYNGDMSSLIYDYGQNCGEEIYSHGYVEKNFGSIILSKDLVFVGDLWKGRPYGFGMLYLINGDKIVENCFCEMYGKRTPKLYGDTNLEVDKEL